jgi:hypothetical protein
MDFKLPPPMRIRVLLPQAGRQGHADAEHQTAENIAAARPDWASDTAGKVPVPSVALPEASSTTTPSVATAIASSQARRRPGVAHVDPVRDCAHGAEVGLSHHRTHDHANDQGSARVLCRCIVFSMISPVPGRWRTRS